jgi:hypothetical protein
VRVCMGSWACTCVHLCMLVALVQSIHAVVYAHFLTKRIKFCQMVS